MSAKKIPDSMMTDVGRLVGTTVFEVRICRFSVELWFIGTATFIVKISKKFSFGFRPGERFTLVANADAHNRQVERTDFVLLQGMRCAQASISGTHFALRFDARAELSVDFDDADFEPLQFTGTSGERNEKLDFDYVL